jgi:hypothetical protein
MVNAGRGDRGSAGGDRFGSDAPGMIVCPDADAAGGRSETVSIRRIGPLAAAPQRFRDIGSANAVRKAADDQAHRIRRTSIVRDLLVA